MAALVDSALLSNTSEFGAQYGGISPKQHGFSIENSGVFGPRPWVLAIGVRPESAELTVKTQLGSVGFDPSETIAIRSTIDRPRALSGPSRLSGRRSDSGRKQTDSFGRSSADSGRCCDRRGGSLLTTGAISLSQSSKTSRYHCGRKKNSWVVSPGLKALNDPARPEQVQA